MLKRDTLNELRKINPGDLSREELGWIISQAETAIDLRDACLLAKERFRQVGMDWLGKGDDPLDAALAKAESIDPADANTPRRDYGGKPAPDFPFR